MANPLSRVVMKNITQRSDKVVTRANSSNNFFNTVHLDKKEEQLLKSIVEKGTKNVASNQTLRTLDSLNSSNINTNESYEAVQKSNTIMTLNELVDKVKKREV